MIELKSETGKTDQHRKMFNLWRWSTFYGLRVDLNLEETL